MSESITNAIIQAIINYILGNSTQTITEKALPYLYPVTAIVIGIITIYLMFSPRCPYSKLSFCGKSCSSYQEYNLPEEKKQVMRLGIDKEIVEGKRGKIFWCARGLSPFEIKRKRNLEDFSVKWMIKKVRENVNVIFRVTKDTGIPFEPLGAEASRLVDELSYTDVQKNSKIITRIIRTLKKWCENLPRDKRGHAYELVDAINEEEETVDKLNALNYVLMYILTLFKERMRFDKIRKFLADFGIIISASSIAYIAIAALYTTYPLGLTLLEFLGYFTLFITIIFTVVFLFPRRKTKNKKKSR